MIAGTDFGGLIARVMPRSRADWSAATSQAKASHLTTVPGQDVPSIRPARPGSTASVAEIVAAADLGRLTRLVILSVDAARHPGGVDLVRGFSSLGSAAILIDLTSCHRVAELTGLGREQSDIAAVAAGTVPFARAIHRDRHSAAHVVPSGGYRMDASGEGLSAHLPLTLSALRQTYECCIVEFDRARIDMLPALLDEETAVVLAASPEDAAAVGAIDAELRAIGLEDVVVMQISEASSD